MLYGVTVVCGPEGKGMKRNEVHWLQPQRAVAVQDTLRYRILPKDTMINCRTSSRILQKDMAGYSQEYCQRIWQDTPRDIFKGFCRILRRISSKDSAGYSEGYQQRILQDTPKVIVKGYGLLLPRKQQGYCSTGYLQRIQ